MSSHKRKVSTTALQHRINTTLQNFSDCSLCTLCCLEGVLQLEESDILTMSRYLHITPQQLVEQYTTYNRRTGEIKITMPCSFLKNNSCIIYPVRPEVCRNYPVFVNRDTVYLYGVETCATATLFVEAYADYLQRYHPTYHTILKKNLEKDPILPDDEMINMQFSAEHLKRFITWLNKTKKQ